MIDPIFGYRNIYVANRGFHAVIQMDMLNGMFNHRDQPKEALGGGCISRDWIQVM